MSDNSVALSWLLAGLAVLGEAVLCVAAGLLALYLSEKLWGRS